MTQPRLTLTRSQILAFRRSVGALDERLPLSAASLRRAAWAGLQDSMPRAALLSLHARIEGVGPAAWEHPSLAQGWGPRFSAYVVPARDVAVFTRGRMPDDTDDRVRFEDLAERLHAFLKGRRVKFAEVQRPLRLPHHNYVRYATTTGRVRIRWDGARQPTVWTTRPSKVAPPAARAELARRYLHVFGPATAESFAKWAGIAPAAGRAAFDALDRSRTRGRTPIGDAWVLTSDEAAFRAKQRPAAAARLLPSGDTYFLLQGADRELLVPDASRRSALWTSRVWPGAVLLAGEIAGIWRRAGADVAIELWRRLSHAERDAVEAEAQSMPLPDVAGRIRVNWV